MKLVLSLLFFLFLFALSCSDDSTYTGECTWKNKEPVSGKSLHGEPCQTDDDCMYGICHKGLITSSEYGICTKICNCGPYSACSDDNQNGVAYTCFKPSHEKYPDEKFDYCVIECKNLDDCKKVADFYNACTNFINGESIGTRKYCVYVKE